MVALGNYNASRQITSAEITSISKSGYSAFQEEKSKGAEAAAYSYIFYRYTSSGEAAKWLENFLQNYDDHAEKKNKAHKQRFKEADEYEAKKLRSDHWVYQKAKNKAEQDKIDGQIAQFKADHLMPDNERRKLRFVSTLRTRRGGSKFTPIVRGVLRQLHEHQSSLVSRYCLALAWIDARFASVPDVSVAMIKSAFIAGGGFHACIEAQSKLGGPETDEEVESVVKAAIQEAAREKVREMPSAADVTVPIGETPEGFTLLLAKVTSGVVSVICDAKAPEVDVISTVNRIGSGLQIDTAPSSQFIGQVLTLSDLITEGQSIMLDDGTTSKQTSSRRFSIRPGADHAPELVVSVDFVEAGPVLIARPDDPEILGLENAAAVMRTVDRKSFEKEFRHPGKRSLVTITLDLKPTKKDKNPADSLMSWNCENSALVRANMTDKAVTKIYFSNLNAITDKPLDIYDFQPQLTGMLTGAEIKQVLAIVPKPSGQSKVIPSEGEEKSNATKSKKTVVPKTVILKFKDDELTVSYGDAPPLILTCKTGCKEVVTVRLRTQDVWNICNSLKELNIQEIEVSPDDRGLVRFAWKDTVGSYGFHQPTCGPEGRLQSRRVAPMRFLPKAAE